jgi:hypothetical protein
MKRIILSAILIIILISVAYLGINYWPSNDSTKSGVSELFSVPLVKAQTSPTFPTDEAGIAAYVQVDDASCIDISALGDAYYSLDAADDTYVIGTVRIENHGGRSNGGADWFNYPHVYTGLDGWIIAYFLKTEESSRITQWKSYKTTLVDYQHTMTATPEITTLKEAIDIVCSSIGCTYSSPITYYNFEFPEATKMTLVVDTADGYQLKTNDFHVTVPGTIYEASYSLYRTDDVKEISLSVNGNYVLQQEQLSVHHLCGMYDPSHFLPNIGSHVVLSLDSFYYSWGGSGNGGLATLLIYGN